MTICTEEAKFRNELEAKENASRSAELEEWIGKQIGQALQQHYPRLRWGIYVDIPGQMICIVCPFVSTTKGYHLLLKNYTIAQLQARAITAGGEILERHGISRHQHVNLENTEGTRRDARDSMVTADSAPEKRTCH